MRPAVIFFCLFGVFAFGSCIATFVKWSNRRDAVCNYHPGEAFRIIEFLDRAKANQASYLDVLIGEKHFYPYGKELEKIKELEQLGTQGKATAQFGALELGSRCEVNFVHGKVVETYPKPH